MGGIVQGPPYAAWQNPWTMVRCDWQNHFVNLEENQKFVVENILIWDHLGPQNMF